MGARLFAVSDNSHLDPLLGMPANWLVDTAATGHHTADYSLILTTNGSRLQLGNQVCVGDKGFSDDH